MAQGKYSASDIAAINGKPVGQYTDADIAQPGATSQPAAPAQPSMWERIKGLAMNPMFGAGDAAKDMRDASTSLPNDFAVENPKLSGAIKGLAGAGADILGMGTSPLALATGGAGVLAKGTGLLARAAGLASKTAGVGFGLKGAADVTDAATNPDLSTTDRLQQALFGGAQMAGGYAGASEQPKYGELAGPLWQKAKAVTNNFAVPGTPTELLVKATKPNVGLGDYEQTLDRTIKPLFDQSQKANAPILNLKNLRDTADTVKNDANAKYQGALSQVSTPIDATPIADKMDSTIPAIDKFQDPINGIVGKTKAESDLYRTLLSPQELDAQRLSANMKLRAAYNKTGGDQAAAREEPGTARNFAIGEGAREALYPEIKNATGVDPQILQQLWGDAQDIGDTAGRRNTVFSRQQPFPLGQQISDAQSIANGKPTQAVLARMFKTFNDSDWLTKEAFSRYGRSTPQPQLPGKMGYGSIAAAMAARR